LSKDSSAARVKENFTPGRRTKDYFTADAFSLLMQADRA